MKTNHRFASGVFLKFAVLEMFVLTTHVVQALILRTRGKSALPKAYSASGKKGDQNLSPNSKGSIALDDTKRYNYLLFLMLNV